jgi:hypothetical protein
MELEAAFAFAISNIAAFGDTDVFPSPFERFLFADLHDKARFLLQEMHHNCDSHLASFPPQNFDMLCPVGYTGFRWVTQIDPIWNAYFLGLVVSIADTIEKSRIAEGERVVFSYRFSPNPETKHLFSDSSWFDFKRRSLELAKQYEFVLVTDIADFYPRVYHHRLENELRRLNLKSDIPSRIMKLLSHFSKTVSYGLPVGGPAARILAELVLRPIDLHLHRRQIPFCRYADDFALFVRSKEEAFGAVALLSDKLFNEGLSLQRNKTRILPSKEFIETSRLIHPLDHTENEAMSPEIVLLGLSVRYDPYSPTADEDYEALKDAVSNIDIVGILSREINKTNIDSQVTKQAIAAVRALGPTLRHEAIETLLDRENLEVLAPVLINILRMIRDIYDDLEAKTQSFVDRTLMELLEKGFYLFSNGLNLLYVIQVIAKKHSERKEGFLLSLYDREQNTLIRRMIIVVMSSWRATFWLSDIKRRFGALSSWERGAFILASYHLNDEGRHWREHADSNFSPMEKLIREWYAGRSGSVRSIPI